MISAGRPLPATSAFLPTVVPITLWAAIAPVFLIGLRSRISMTHASREHRPLGPMCREKTKVVLPASGAASTGKGSTRVPAVERDSLAGKSLKLKAADGSHSISTVGFRSVYRTPIGRQTGTRESAAFGPLLLGLFRVPAMLNNARRIRKVYQLNICEAIGDHHLCPGITTFGREGDLRW